MTRTNPVAQHGIACALGGLQTLAPPRGHRPLGTVAVPDHTDATMGQPKILQAGQERLGFQLDRLREEPPRAGARHFSRGIVDIVGLTKANNVGRVGQA